MLNKLLDSFPVRQTPHASKEPQDPVCSACSVVVSNGVASDRIHPVQKKLLTFSLFQEFLRESAPRVKSR